MPTPRTGVFYATVRVINLVYTIREEALDGPFGIAI
jgi:hypothetical protein